MSILALNKVNYSYKNGKKVLNDISMEFEKGKFYAILGVSGSGKTTLLSLLAGLDEPRNGEILYNNQNIKVFIVKYDKEKVKPYVMRLKKIQKYKQFFVESGKLPKKKCRNCDTKRAQECGMRDACWEIGKGRKKLTVSDEYNGVKA